MKQRPLRHTVSPSHFWFALALLVVFILWWVVLAVAPWYREDWLLENVLVLLVVPWLVFTYQRFPLSKLSYGLVFVFLCLHEVGAHYTYSKVPYDAWMLNWSGTTVTEQWALSRNHYDRVVHCLFGVLLTYPFRELFLRIANVRGFWGYFLPFLLVVAMSTTFELIEWLAALLFGEELGMAYLGTQGDIWDAQKDMTLASAGALFAIIVIAAVSYALNRDFAREWSDSLHVKHEAPLGEVEIARLLAQKRGRTG